MPQTTSGRHSRRGVSTHQNSDNDSAAAVPICATDNNSKLISSVKWPIVTICAANPSAQNTVSRSPKPIRQAPP